MEKKRKNFYLIFYISMFLYFLWTEDIIIPIVGVIIFNISIIVISLVYDRIQQDRRLRLLNFDPQRYIDVIEKELATCKSPKLKNTLKLNKALGCMLIGDSQKAKETLLSIDKSYLSEKDHTLYIYEIHLMTCLYELGEISQAEEIFKTYISTVQPINKKTALEIEWIKAKRLFFLGRYKESKKEFEQLLLDKNRQKLGILTVLHYLAQIDEKEGNIEAAKKKYKKLIDEGNRLWMAKHAQIRLEEINYKN